MIVAFFPLVEANPGYVDMAKEVWSEELMAAFGGAGLEFTTLGGFLGIEYLSLIWVFILGAAVITFAAGAIGGAVENGTMEVTLSQPVSRSTAAATWQVFGVVTVLFFAVGMYAFQRRDVV